MLPLFSGLVFEVYRDGCNSLMIPLNGLPLSPVFRAALQPLLRLLMDSLDHLVLLFGLLWRGTGTLGFWIRAKRYQGVPACEEVSTMVAKPVLGDFFNVCDSVASLCRLNPTYVSNPKLPHC